MRDHTTKEKGKITAGAVTSWLLWDGLSCWPSHFYRQDKTEATTSGEA